MAELSGTIGLPPLGKGRPKFGKGRTYTPEATRKWEEDAVTLMRAELARNGQLGLLPLQGPLQATVYFYTPRPKSHYRTNGLLRLGSPVACTTKPDIDNLQKSLFDAMQNAGILEDDSAIVAVHAYKIWRKTGSISWHLSETPLIDGVSD